MTDLQEGLKRLQDKLSELGLPLTDQRRVIYEALVGRDDHPTAEEVLSQVRRALPRMSLATVYRTLERLAAIGVVRKVAHQGAAARYDANLRRHHHLHCDRCGGIYDVEAPELDDMLMPRISGGGIQIREYSFQLRGLCRACAKRRPKGVMR